MGKPTPPTTRARKKYVAPKMNRQTIKKKPKPPTTRARKKHDALKMNQQTIMEKPTPPTTRARMKHVAPKMNWQTIMKKPTPPTTRVRTKHAAPKMKQQRIMEKPTPPTTRARKEHVAPKMNQQTTMKKPTPPTARHAAPKMNRRRLRPRSLRIDRSQNDSPVAGPSTRKRPAERLEKCGENKRAKTDSSDKTKEKVHKVQEKRVKPNKTDKGEPETREQSATNDANENEPILEAHSDNDWCNLCGQLLSDPDLRFFQGNAEDALEEHVALAELKHNMCDGPNNQTQYDLTDFTIFDKTGHMCSLDGNLIELGIDLYMSGYILVTSKQSIKAVPVKELGPITEWWITEYSRTEKSYVIIKTENAEYRIGNSNVYYAPLMNSIYEKICIRKVIIEYIESKKHLRPTELSYTDLLGTMEERKVPETDTAVNEEMLHRHAHFVFEAVSGVNNCNNNSKILSLPCMRDLTKKSGIKLFKGCQSGKNITTVHKHKAPKKTSAKDNVHIVLDKQDEELEKAAPWSRATTTPIVRQHFKLLFCNEMDTTEEEAAKKKRCGICEACQLPDCGKCSGCKNMARFGGSGRMKKCKRRVCHGLAHNPVKRMINEDLENTYADQNENITFEERAPKCIEWIGNQIKENEYAYYDQVKINDILYKRGDFVAIKALQNDVPTLIGRIVYMYKDIDRPKDSYIHAQLFMRSSDTALGEIGNPTELFLIDRCYHAISLSSILWKAVVENKAGPETGSAEGQKILINKYVEDDGKHYFYKKFYNMYNLRFEDLPVDPVANDRRKHRSCPSCDRKTAQEFLEIPIVCNELCDNVINLEDIKITQWASVKYHGQVYNKHCAVFLQPVAFKMPNSLRKRSKYTQTTLKKVDEDIYPEFYRKTKKGPSNFNLTARRMFTIGYIEAILTRGYGKLVSPQDIFLRIRVMYRPENTVSRTPQNEDWNKVYWTEHITEVPFKHVVGPCHLYYEGNIPDRDSPKEWLEKDPTRFYFIQAYDHHKCKFVKLPNEALSVGKSCSGKGKGKGKGKKKIDLVDEPKVQRLRAMDLFAGCGGLSEGLHQAGIADCKWAIENNKEAANAFSLNNKNCTVIAEDCNAVLKDVLAGAKYSASGKPLPQKGEVDLICGGPPCQGFSGMNRFHTRQYSTFQNSLVATFLSFCEHYRPKYIIMENVRNFVAFKKGMMVKLTLRSLLAMEYQCTVAILQAGNYGIPQTRRRVIVLAAAPGCKLPLYPQPDHVFNRIGCRLSMKIDNKVYTSNIRTFRSAPRRTCTIYDAMSDLPNISNGECSLEMDYATKPLTHFQRMVRSKDENSLLTDHICKKMSALALARIERIPMEPGADWRDLPNIEVTLSDGSKTKILKYLHHDKIQGPSKSGKPRGVCKCVSERNKQYCDLKYKQDHTLIPWGMAHTANNNNNWGGVYGRLSWYNFFRTTVTDPEPSGKQGRVLHPDQHRVVSVRECARSQGFRDSYLFSGSIQEKHCQIGNAVPPPLAAAIGRELKKALSDQN